MEGSKISAVVEEFSSTKDQATEEEYAEQFKLLQEFTETPDIDRVWTFKSDSVVIDLVYVSSFTTHCSVVPIVIKLCSSMLILFLLLTGDSLANSSSK